VPSQEPLASFERRLIAGPKKYRTYIVATSGREQKPRVAKAHFVLKFSNIATPACANEAAIRKLGMRKAAMALAATFG
jgi:hypothetical protein